ncbi:DUF4127 family protein [Numidum massiliense]|uniref:DUF4127 family protein n=1 Tax=Numidum massiliense TaxID=1522315 RepID=UPI0006D568CB|nr:DUF4127 family protein [Numidum massiliense]
MARKIAIVPLDDRPCCYSFTERLGQIGAVEVVQPPKEILGKFTEPGCGDSLNEWLETTAPHVDGLVIAIDQLAYGGLVASRTMDRTLEVSLAYVNVLKKIKTKYPQLPIYAASVLMRLSITSKNAEYNNYWRDVFQYSRLYDYVHRLGKEEYKEELNQIERKIPSSVLEEYLLARKRNHFINKQMIDWVADDVLDFLIITQEDASDVGLHLSEQRVLMEHIFEKKVQERVMLYPGADEATQTLLARMVHYFRQAQVKIYPKYLSLAGRAVVPKFEDRPLEEAVRAHIAAAGALCVESIEEADLLLYINTPLDDQSVDGFKGFGKKAYFHSRHQYWDFIASMKHYMSKGYPVVVADLAFPNAADLELIQLLLQNGTYMKLAGYAGWNTSGNSLGTCISHGVMSVLWQTGESVESTALQAHLQFLIERLLDEWAYQANVRTEVNHWLEQTLQISPSYLGDDYERVDKKVRQGLKRYFEEVKDVLIGSVFKVNDSTYAMTRVECTHVALPWNRTFEVDVSVSCELETLG